MKEAEKVSSVVCECKKQIGFGTMRMVNNECLEKLKESDDSLNRPEGDICTCFFCKNVVKIDSIRFLACGHKWCIDCLKAVMVDYKGGKLPDCCCETQITNSILKGVDWKLYSAFWSKYKETIK